MFNNRIWKRHSFFGRMISFLVCACIVAGSILFLPADNVVNAASNPVQAHGRLSVSGTQLVDKTGKAYQLRGISTHGLQWFGQYNNKAAYKTLRDDWGANCIRLAMYSDAGGYVSDPSGMKQKVIDGVNYATELGMYVIIDWHILSDGNPNQHRNEAREFFRDMSNRYKNHSNVIYEICNEPNGCSWGDIKSYAEDIIGVIRSNDKNAIIIVGTPTWSQLGSQGHTYEPADDPIRGYSNLMYAFHFYASDSSHNQWIKNKIPTAISKGLPVFVSEFGLSEASGDGNVDLGKAKEWLQMCDNNKVSYCAWSLCNKGESSALISSGCSKLSGWSEQELSKAGKFIRDWYRSKKSTDNVDDTPKIKNQAKDVILKYKTHVQTFGWQEYVTAPQMSGTSGLSKRLEGICIKIEGNPNLGITYKTHVQTYGWQDWKSDGDMSGTSRQSKRLEAICIKLTGKDKDKYDVYYRVHAQTYGWMGWAKNGQIAGTERMSKRLEAINIVVLKKGMDPGVSTYKSHVSPTSGNINYRTHVQTYGWQKWVSDSDLSGTTLKSKRLEGIEIRLGDNISGGIKYKTHVQSYGWQDWKTNGDMSGTQGKAKRLEAICIMLTGQAEKQYDIYYQVHVQSYGWLDWAKNGQMSGTSGLYKRLEAIRIVLVPKGGKAPGKTTRPSIAVE